MNYKHLEELVNQYVNCEDSIQELQANRQEELKRPFMFEDAQAIHTYERELEQYLINNKNVQSSLDNLIHTRQTLKFEIYPIIEYLGTWYKVCIDKGAHFIQIIKRHGGHEKEIHTLTEKEYCKMIEKMRKDEEEYEEEYNENELNNNNEDWGWYKEEVPNIKDHDGTYNYVVTDAQGVHSIQCHSEEHANKLTQVLNECTIPEY